MPFWKRDPIQDELTFHFEELKRERLEAGDSPEEAERYARRKLGHTAALRHEVQDLSLHHRLTSIGRHVRFALRSYRRHGGAYGSATAILAVGIGLSVAMFSLVEAVVLKPLPFPGQDQIHLIWKTDLQDKSALVGELAYPELDDLKAGIPQLERIALFPAALYGNGRVLQVGAQEPVQFESCPATSDFFKVLGVAPVLGRDFKPEDSKAPVVMLSDRVWREQFGARRDVVGEIIRLNGRGYTVIGVMGPEVDFPRGVGLWVPLPRATQRGMTWLQAIARVRPGTTREALLDSAERAFQIQIRDHLKEYSVTQRAVVTPLSTFLTGASKSQLLLSLAASLLLLLSACLSAGNLFLSRALVRRREVATRISLGASTSHLFAQFAIEALVTAVIATTAGALLAAGVIRILQYWAPADIPRIETAGLNLAALGFAATAALLATTACCFGPMLLLRRKNLDALLREGGVRNAGSRSGGRLQGLFVFAQAAVTVAILGVGSLLFLSYRALLRTETGFSNRDAVTMNLALRGQTPESYRRFYVALLDRLRASQGVFSAAGVLLRPLEGPIGWDTEYTFEFEEGRRDPNQLTKANFEVVTTQYFATVGTPLLQGRDFNEHDTAQSEKVLVISRSLAGKIRAAGRDPLGQRLRVFGEWRKVVGVAADARYRRIAQPGEDVYVPSEQIDVPTNYLVIRGAAPPADLLALVRRTLKAMDPAQAIAGEATLGSLIDRNLATSRFHVSLLILFALGAVVLAAAGIHSVIRESVTVRAREMALRIALGADRGRLALQTTRAALLLVATGEITGLAAALLIARSASGLLYNVSATDPLVAFGVAAFVFTIALGSAWAPAWIAAGQDPRERLQAE